MIFAAIQQGAYERGPDREALMALCNAVDRSRCIQVDAETLFRAKLGHFLGHSPGISPSATSLPACGGLCKELKKSTLKPKL